MQTKTGRVQKYPVPPTPIDPRIPASTQQILLDQRVAIDQCSAHDCTRLHTALGMIFTAWVGFHPPSGEQPCPWHRFGIRQSAAGTHAIGRRQCM